MSVSDLTNTKWVLDNTLGDIQSMAGGYEATYNINFVSNETTNTSMTFTYDIGSDIGTGDVQNQGLSYYSYGRVYDSYNNTWANTAFQTIEISGGTDATNSTLISWLESNATQQVEPTSSTTNKIGGLSIIKKHFGDLEVIKEVLNGATIYEAVKTYTITTTITNGSYTGDSTITNTASVTISANTGYSLPSTISVSGATYTYDSTTGVVNLSNPSGNVTIEATCVASYPVKTDIITMNIDGTNKKFRVLKNVSGSVFEVLGMFTLQAQFNTSGTSTAFKNSNLDTYLNTTWYETLNATAKSAIVTGAYEQRNYTVSSSSTSVNTTYDKEWYYYKNDVSSSTTYVWCRPQSHTASSGLFSGDFTSKIYTLTAYKIIEYLNPQNTISYNNTPFTAKNIYKMVSGYTNAINVALADAEYTGRLGQINSSGSLCYASYGYISVTTNSNWYPLFQIDLSKISFTKN